MAVWRCRSWGAVDATSGGDPPARSILPQTHAPCSNSCHDLVPWSSLGHTTWWRSSGTALRGIRSVAGPAEGWHGGPVGDDVIKAHLHQKLRAAREALVWKLGGVAEYDVRRRLTPTGTNLLGLVKHNAISDARYFGEVFGRLFPEPLPGWDDPAADLVDHWGRAARDPGRHRRPRPAGVGPCRCDDRGARAR